jgi:hypothetical protein
MIRFFATKYVVTISIIVESITLQQCCGAGARAARSRNFWPELELEPVFAIFSSGSRLRVELIHVHNSCSTGSSQLPKSVFFWKKSWKINILIEKLCKQITTKL